MFDIDAINFFSPHLDLFLGTHEPLPYEKVLSKKKNERFFNDSPLPSSGFLYKGLPVALNTKALEHNDSIRSDHFSAKKERKVNFDQKSLQFP